MKPKLTKLDYKGAQKVTRMLLRMGHPLSNGGTVDLGIKAFKRSGATPTQIKQFKEKAWKGLGKKDVTRPTV